MLSCNPETCNRAKHYGCKQCGEKKNFGNEIYFFTQFYNIWIAAGKPLVSSLLKEDWTIYECLTAFSQNIEKFNAEKVTEMQNQTLKRQMSLELQRKIKRR